ncbi:Membrane associated serine protease, rhomboid family [Daejeonella rubra]|uniref:Membrane associated serine protease, rhomboid family n=1 Tax=Daejeonella rubra TaxID=990371 RepID=A0A1G9WBB4_9SPHI|nr:rhomboid family intramembrane serine protease [Daejeonella rubra]SDM81760.1 Membrane associated serine protease, rhomboid family [Daejeonella rubra]
MNRSIFSELFNKAFRSGNPLFLFIGINILVFTAINLFALGEYLVGGQSSGADWLTSQVSVPAYYADLPLKFWTIITYMFVQRDFFHLLFNMLWMYWMGLIFMDFLNKRQFIFVYFSGGIAGALLYLLAYNTIPVFMNSAQNSILLGSSASVMAIVVATATLVPDFTIRLMLFGTVRLKYLAMAYFVLDIIGMGGGNPGGSIAHIGGALMGFIFIKQLQSGNDLSKILTKRSKLKVVKSTESKPVKNDFTDQATIDSILDKISKSGYDSLSKTEKEQLFKASKK